MPDRPENSIVPIAAVHDPVVYAEAPYAPQPAPQSPNIFRTIHGSLRGRYLIVGALSFTAMLAGAVGGFLSGHLLYRTDALIHVQPRMPKILYESEQTSLLPNFASFVNTQASLVKHDRVISQAVNSEPWLRTGRGNSPGTIAAFRSSLTATSSRDMPEFISVSFTDADPKSSFVGLEQSLRAYEELFGAESKGVTTFKTRQLENRRLDFQSKLETIRTEIREAAKEYGTEDLTPLQAQKMQRLLDVDLRISELELQLAERAPVPSQGRPGDTKVAPLAAATPEQIALSDATMAQYLSQRNDLEQSLASLKAQGFGDKHPEVARANSHLEPLRLLITNHANGWNEARRGMAVSPTEPGLRGVVLETTEQLQARLTRLKAQADQWHTEAVSLGNKRLNIEAFKRDESEVLAKLKEASDRLDAINFESKVEQNMSRIEVLYPESAPTAPSVDTRKKYALLGAAAGFCGVTGLAFLLGLIDRRCRYSDELDQATSDTKLLACLPVMGARADPESLAVAAHCIHRIRVRLEIVSPDHRTIAITSASPGDGKTSMAMSLGISYAGVGRRTLLIDLDIVGRGLSARLGLNDATDLAEALAKGTPEGLARPSHIANMDVLAIGPRSHASPSRLRSETVRKLLHNAARLYDTVVIDTGPLLGSLEANFACSVADAVLLVVGRGQSRTLVQRAVKQLQEINARLAGIVFNRARNADFRASSMSASIRSVRAQPFHPNGHRPSGVSGLDPLADAVLVDSLEDGGLDPDSPSLPS